MNDVVTTIDRLSVMQAALKKLPLNPLGLPDIIFRPDLLPTEPDPDTFDSALKVASQPLSYLEGFPTQLNGFPFWAQLDFEPIESFKLFESYLQLGIDPKVGTRQLHLLETPSQPRPHLIECFTYYYWPYRSKAYDIFRAAASRRTRELLALDLENRHFKKANELYDKLMFEVFEGGGDDDKVGEFWETLGAHGAIKFLKLLVDWQRLSIGLPSGGSNGGYTSKADQQNAITPNASFEVVFRQLAQRMAGGEQPASGQSGTSYEDRQNQALTDLRRLLATDTNVATLAQELIIRMTQASSLEAPPVASHIQAAQGDMKSIIG